MAFLDILDEDVFKGEKIDPDIARQTEENFYRGAPPLWLNFYLAEQNTAEGRFIKRDGYDELLQQILSNKSVVHLNHKPGSGGTTLAMQLLWDLRKSFKCAVLVDPSLESSLIATAVIDLYAAGESNNRKTVLLLVQDGNVNTLREGFVAELSKRKIDSDKPVIVILNCVRIAHINAERSDVNLVDHLTVDEKKNFDTKKEWLNHKYPDMSEFHGFNIMQSNFSQDYVKRAWDACRPLVLNPGSQHIACLCLLNSYVPGSSFLKSCCEKFEETSPFLRLTVSFNRNGSDSSADGGEVLRMAHPMIAEYGNQVFQEAGMMKNVTANTLLKRLCTEDHILFLSEFIKKLLITRQKDDFGKTLRFSRFILDIKTGNTGKKTCLLVLKEAVKLFPQIGSYPQTLSRFYYLEMADYPKALKWAKEAKLIAPNNSFIADTLGQVYKHHLNRELQNELNTDTLTRIFDLAKEAFDAFEDAENLAESESTTFNVSSKSSYLKVANNLFERKKDFEEATERKKRKEYHKLISPLSDNIKKRAIFINMLLNYSDKSFDEKEPEYVLREARQCYKDYKCGEDLKDGLGTGDREEQLRSLHKNWLNDTQEPRLKLKMMVENLKASFHETHEKYFRSRKLRPLLYLEIDGDKERVVGEVRFHKLYTTVGDEEIQLDVAPAKQLALWRSGTVTFELGFTIRGPTAYNIQFPN